MKKSLIVVAIAALASACNQQPAPVPMVQMCGVNPQTMQQSCVMVPQNQMAQANQNGYYQYNPSTGQYRDSHGDAVVAGVVGAAAGYMLGQHLAGQNNQPRQTYNNERPRDAQGRFAPNTMQQPMAAPIAVAPGKAFVPEAVATKQTSKAPTGGMMAGKTDMQLTSGSVPAPAPAFKPTAAQAYAPTPAPVAPAFKPTATSQPQKAPTTFTPSSAMKSTVPAAAKTSPAFKPSSAKTTTTKSSSFKPTSATKK